MFRKKKNGSVHGVRAWRTWATARCWGSRVESQVAWPRPSCSIPGATKSSASTSRFPHPPIQGCIDHFAIQLMLIYSGHATASLLFYHATSDTTGDPCSAPLSMSLKLHIPMFCFFAECARNAANMKKYLASQSTMQWKLLLQQGTIRTAALVCCGANLHSRMVTSFSSFLQICQIVVLALYPMQVWQYHLTVQFEYLFRL